MRTETLRWSPREIPTSCRRCGRETDRCVEVYDERGWKSTTWLCGCPA